MENSSNLLPFQYTVIFNKRKITLNVNFIKFNGEQSKKDSKKV